jgi:preprotein translocase subunit SecA
MLKRRGIKHETLNAKFHEKEAVIVAQAGRSGAVTIATNMAGRGTDILLGGNPAGLASEILHRKGLNPAEVDTTTYDTALAEARDICEADHVRVVEAGGLHIIGTERHDSRRIDNQLRGRSGRQGDPGSSRFYLSLDDDLMKRFASERVAGLMERMGLEDDVAIESRLVSKTIESAQTRVEGYNFDIRKRVVEFDDVINKQRETIYAERDKVLRNEDLTETIRAFVADELEAMAAQHLAGAVEDWNVEAFSNELRRMGIDASDISDDELWEPGGSEAIVGRLQEIADQKLERRASEVGEEDWRLVERLVLLRTIDSLWVEHLTELDDMRRGIGLRGYAQQDPLNEFRKEAFALYEELSGFIRHQVAGTIFRVTVTRTPAPAGGPTPLPGPGQPPRAVAGPPRGPVSSPVAPAAGSTAMSGATPAGRTMGVGGAAAGAGAQGPRPGFTPTGARIGRNEPCWCGSGQKYKRCHGR